ncbi:hypothetical protein [Fulvimonas soli]|uniref:Uncharacterized protein n=1 Tax=Fulvimonas soli TaxID=155197 RepID=A0A316IID0_9GAMM|nr:hypothetical protein [Fulvimonas soli]PWK92476.1 hypothetical protein C7456_102211 [Fulvimonas soli]TNY27147.1 hypothetical protein BV497_04915 [Fulvimonas soli]
MPPNPVPPADAGRALSRFVGHARRMLDPSTPEAVRRRLEPRLLALLPVVRALGLFELFAVRDRALAVMLRDELAALEQRHARGLARAG